MQCKNFLFLGKVSGRMFGCIRNRHSVLRVVLFFAVWLSAWTSGAAQSLTWLGTLGGDWSVALDVSADGSVVIGVALNSRGQERAFRWTASSGMEDIGALGGWNSAAYGISADGLDKTKLTFKFLIC